MPVATAMLWVCTVLATEAPRQDSLTQQKPGRADIESASPLEAAFSARAGEALRLFGHDLFAHLPDRGTPAGAIQGDYPLNTGDELLVTLRGPKSFSKRFPIDTAGMLIVDDIRPVAAAGLSLAALRSELAAAVSASLPNTETFVSLSEVRRIAVIVTGAVTRPGRQEIGAFATVLDALSAAGGIARSGSLRRIRLVRTGEAGEGRTIDLYDLQMTGGGGAEIRLRDGDRLFVPPVGPTIGVAGPVQRPAIYELLPDRQSVSVAELSRLAGGLLRPGAHRALRFGIGPSGEEIAEEVDNREAPLFGAGDLLLLSPVREDRRNEVRLEGHVFRPGPRSLDRSGTLSRLVGRADLRPDPYLPFAVLASADPAGRTRLLRPVDLGALLNGRDASARATGKSTAKNGGQGAELKEGDTLYVLGPEEVDYLSSAPVLDLLRGQRDLPVDACPGLVQLSRTLAASPDGLLATGPQARAAAELTGARPPCPALFQTAPDLLPFALAHSTLVLSGVRRPGFYPTADGAGSAPAPAAGPAAGPAQVPVVEDTTPRYELLGHVRRPGTRPLLAGTTLRSVLRDGDEVRRDAYPLLGLVERFERRGLERSLIPFSPQEVSAGRADRKLADGDRIYLFDAAWLRGQPPSAGDSPVAGKAAAAGPSVRSALVDHMEMLDPGIAALIGERSVQVRGAVRQPGAYPVADATPVTALIAAAGGLANDADPAAVELTAAGGGRSILDLGRPADSRRTVGPGDAIRVNPTPPVLEAKAVTIEGAVRRPGSYDIARGETLSSLIQRAGGLTEEAYPAGAIFTRESERRREKERFLQQARELERTLTLEVEKGEPVKAENVALARQLAAQLRGTEPLGRVVVEADPAMLRRRPELDMLLEPEDRIAIPKRPLTVAVAGEVLHPAAVQFVSGKDAADYLQEAGGPTRNADPGRSFLILPDGRAQPLSLSSWNHRVDSVPPGSILVVPRDPKPFDSLDFTKAVGNILGQLAITAASISVISR